MRRPPRARARPDSDPDAKPHPDPDRYGDPDPDRHTEAFCRRPRHHPRR